MKRRHFTLTKAIISVFLLGLIVSRFNPAELWQVIRNAHFGTILVAAAFSPAILFIKAFKWLLLARQVDPSISFRSASMSLLAGMGVGLVTPGRIGEVSRGAFLNSNRRTSLATLVAVDRSLDLVAILLAGAAAVSLALNMRLAIWPIAFSVGLLILLFVPGPINRLVTWLGGLALLPKRDLLREVALGLAVARGHVLAPVFGLASLTFALGVVQFHWLLRSLDQGTLLAAAVSFPILTVAGVLPITIAGFGTREGAAVLVLGLYNITEAVAIDATLISFLLNSLIPGVIGLALSPLLTGSARPLQNPRAGTISDG